MIRSMVGFAGFAIVAWLALKLLSLLFGIVFGILGTILWFAFWGFIFYLILKVFAPGLAERVRETIRGKPSSAD